jgi:tRNA1Val (adenine37-N6)-methyltransferase
MALHSTELNFQELIDVAKKMLSPSGYFAVLLPYERTLAFEEMAKDFYIIQKVLLKQTPKHSYFRSILIFSKQVCNQINPEEIIIKETNEQYSAKFKNLLASYYLLL